jgi:hypothetical protein
MNGRSSFQKFLRIGGSFTYDQSEDAVRVNVKPVAAESHNALTYDFDQVQADSVVVELSGTKLQCHSKFQVYVHAVVLASLKKQLRGLATVHMDELGRCSQLPAHRKIDFNDALTYANKSIEVGIATITR